MTELTTWTFAPKDEFNKASTTILYSFSASEYWITVLTNTARPSISLYYSQFIDAMTVLKQFEFVATDTIANSGVVDPTKFYLAEFADRYDYDLMELVDPTADGNVDFSAWCNAIAQLIAFEEIAKANYFYYNFSLEDLEEDGVTLTMSEDAFAACDYDEDGECENHEWPAYLAL